MVWYRNTCLQFIHTVEIIPVPEQLEKEKDRDDPVAVYPDGRKSTTGSEIFKIEDMLHHTRNI
jgi:hypothetical protein